MLALHASVMVMMMRPQRRYAAGRMRVSVAPNPVQLVQQLRVVIPSRVLKSCAAWTVVAARAARRATAGRMAALQAAQAALVTCCTLRAPRRAAPAAAPAAPRARRAHLRIAAPPRASAAEADAAPTVESLTAAHGITGSVAFARGAGGLLKAVLTHANGSSAEVHLHGATVTSYCQPSGDEVLFVRPDAVFDGSRPIAGGVPICFPIFGPPPASAPSALAQHGFARSSAWRVHRSSADVNPDYPEPCVTLKLSDSEATRAAWPHAFDALLEVTLKRDALRLDLRVRNANADGRPFDFTAALHSYFEVVDAALPAVRVTGLKGKAYLDKVPDPKAPVRRVDDAPAVTFGKALVDRVYLDTEPETLLEVGTGAAVSVEHGSGWTDTVVWNPHTTLPACWSSFVCVESAVTRPVTLQAGYVWEAETKICVIDL